MRSPLSSALRLSRERRPRASVLSSSRIGATLRVLPILRLGGSAMRQFESKLELAVDERLAWASTIPSRLYVDPRWLEAEKEKVFSRACQFVDRQEQVA